MLGIPDNKTPKPVNKLTIFLVGAVLLVALILKVVDFFKPDKVPTATLPTTDLSTTDSDDEPLVIEPNGTVETPKADSSNEEAVISSELNLPVIFVPQAPSQVWDEFHEETCEEASVLMAYWYFGGVKEQSIEVMEEYLRNIVAVQESMGLGLSVSLADLKRSFEAWGTSARSINLQIVDDPTVEEIKQALNENRLVIVPAFGRKLGNPFFTGEGPLYHMLLIKGYTKDGKFITNDPGTRHGADYMYDEKVIMEATGDWDGDSPDGGKRVMIVSKQ